MEIDIILQILLGMVVHLLSRMSRSVLFQRMISMAVLCPLPRDPFRDLPHRSHRLHQLFELAFR